MSKTREQNIDREVFDFLLHYREWSVQKLEEIIADCWAYEYYNEAELDESIQRLRALGCNIESAPDGIHRMEQSGLGTWEDYLRSELYSNGIVFPLIRVYQETASTQDIAKSFSPGRTLILADQQTAGRGRLQRQWVSKPGTSILLSICWPMSETHPKSHDRMSMLVGVAVAKAVESLPPNKVTRLKWPNDVMIDERKLSGILIEKAPNAYIIGIGLNVTRESISDPELMDSATCLHDLGYRIDRLLVIKQILIELDRTLRMVDNGTILDEWRIRSMLGQTQTFENDGEQITGEVIDLDPDHGLIVRRETGEIVTLPAATTSVVK